MNVVFRFDAGPGLREEIARLEGGGIEIRCAPESSDAAYEALLPGCEVLWHVLKPVDAGQIARAPGLRLIQKIGSGVNTIDLEAARARGIAVCNLPGTNSRAVAELALGLMLACLRRLPALDRAVREPGGWHGAWALQDEFHELGGKTVGLVGAGAVPRLLRPVLEALGAKVLWWSRSERSITLEALLAASDLVSLHVPLTPETRHLVDPRRMKRGAILVNTARGGLVDEQLLAECLASGHLRGAGLDVFAEEPASPSHPLLAFGNVVAAPHVAWLTRQTFERSLGLALDNVRRLREGQPLQFRVA